METIIFKIFLIVHVIGGSMGLISGLINIIRKKGDKYHKLVGKTFFISMMIAGASALMLSFLHRNYFLFMVGIFTLYMVYTGQIYLKSKPLEKKIYARSDLIFFTFILLLGLGFIGLGLLNLIKSNWFGLVFVCFGCIIILFVRQDILNFSGKSKTINFWLIAHLQRMIGAFIAAATAFLVVNAKYFPQQIPGFVYWLLPTILLTPLINKWSKIYSIRKKE